MLAISIFLLYVFYSIDVVVLEVIFRKQLVVCINNKVHYLSVFFCDGKRLVIISDRYYSGVYSVSYYCVNSKFCLYLFPSV